MRLVGAFSAMTASGALADETFWYGYLEPYVAKASTAGLVDIIQGEGWSGESCIVSTPKPGTTPKRPALAGRHRPPARSP